MRLLLAATTLCLVLVATHSIDAAKADVGRHGPQTGALEPASDQFEIVTRVGRIHPRGGVSQAVGGRPAGCQHRV